MYEIKIADQKDGEAVREFIHSHWKENHIFVTSKELFDWQHLDRKRNRYNFVIGVHNETQEIHGILGFIPLSQYDPEMNFNRLCWMAIWKTMEAARGHRLGRRLLEHLEEAEVPEIISTVAASEMTLPMYEAKGFQTGVLDQFYILNPDKKEFHLLNQLEFQKDQNMRGHSNKKLKEISEEYLLNHTESCFVLQKELPRKTPNYIANRYVRHPFYEYQVYGIFEGDEIQGILVTRVCSHPESYKAIRVVEFIGPSKALCGLYENWVEILKNWDAEYIDFYCAGINPDHLRESGFSLCESKSTIPSYFEPFSNEKIEIAYMTSLKKGQGFRIVKGDSDQDRPNLLPH